MTSPHHKIRRRLARTLPVLFSVFLLASCSSDGGGDWLSIFKSARSAWENRDAPVDLNEAGAIPFATLGVRIDEGREQILILAVDANGERLWTSAARIAITTRNGRIVRTAGFATDLTGYDGGGANATNWSRPHNYSWTGDFSDLGLYSVLVNCGVRPVGADPVTILGKELDTIRVEETCHSDELNWTFSNTYWVSAQSGRVWKSIEHVHPKGPVLEIELLRPPLSPG